MIAICFLITFAILALISYLVFRDSFVVQFISISVIILLIGFAFLIFSEEKNFIEAQVIVFILLSVVLLRSLSAILFQKRGERIQQ